MDQSTLLKSVPRLFATVFIGDTPAIALVDGGANINCIHKRILDNLEKNKFSYMVFGNNLGQVGTAQEMGNWT